MQFSEQCIMPMTAASILMFKFVQEKKILNIKSYSKIIEIDS